MKRKQAIDCFLFSTDAFFSFCLFGFSVILSIIYQLFHFILFQLWLVLVYELYLRLCFELTRIIKYQVYQTHNMFLCKSDQNTTPFNPDLKLNKIKTHDVYVTNISRPWPCSSLRHQQLAAVLQTCMAQMDKLSLGCYVYCIQVEFCAILFLYAVYVLHTLVVHMQPWNWDNLIVFYCIITWLQSLLHLHSSVACFMRSTHH